jgi:hypothetical protein
MKVHMPLGNPGQHHIHMVYKDALPRTRALHVMIVAHEAK